MSIAQSSTSQNDKAAFMLQSIGINENNTGSSEFQITSLTRRIGELSAHLKKHPKDHSSQRSLAIMINQRKSLMRYLQGRNPQSLNTLTEKLGIRNTAL
jgi:small subunit ribosomal protein S15